MTKFLNKHILFVFRVLLVAIVGMTFLIGFSRMTANYEMSLAYISIGFVCLMWTLYKFFERGVGRD